MVRKVGKIPWSTGPFLLAYKCLIFPPLKSHTDSTLFSSCHHIFFHRATLLERVVFSHYLQFLFYNSLLKTLQSGACSNNTLQMLFSRSPVTSSLLKAMVNSQFSFNLAHQQHLIQLYAFSFLKCCLYLAPYPPHPAQLLTKPWFPGYHSVLITPFQSHLLISLHFLCIYLSGFRPWNPF